MLQEYKLYQGKELIKFDDEKHIFYDSKGNPLISVTSATGVIDKSGVLTGWAVKMMGLYLLDAKEKGNDKITEELINRAKREYRLVKAEAADIGTAIHDWASEWIKNNKQEMPDDERIVNGITAFLKFQQEHKVKWLESEKVIYSKKYKFAGIMDAVGTIGKDLILFDFKSGNGIYPEMSVQTAGYQLAYEEESGKEIKKRIIARFGKYDGKFEVKELNNHENDKKAFIAALQLKKWLKNNS